MKRKSYKTQRSSEVMGCDPDFGGVEREREIEGESNVTLCEVREEEERR